MNHKQAFDILEIDISTNITLDLLKKKYHKLALKNHPDKNANTQESNDKFQRINEAYDFLKREMPHLQNTETKEEPKFSPVYTDLLNMFLFEGKYGALFSKIVKEIVSCYKKDISCCLFEDLDRDTALNIYSFLTKYNTIFHLSQEILDEVREIVIRKCENTTVYTLNPSITDLLEHNVYKLYHDNELYLVPLWHSELYFESKESKEIIVLCEPQLTNGMTIDEDNNLYVETIILASDFVLAADFVIDNSTISIDICNKTFEIPRSELYLKREQFYRLKGKGMSKIKDDIYDISERADIIVKIIVI